MRLRIALLLALAAAPALAQAPAPAAVAPDPARVTAAKALIATVLPPENRAAMIAQMASALSANMTQAFATDAQLKAAFDADPRARAIFDRFIARSSAETIAYLQASLPGMADAMTLAYARRFTVAQMAELKAFFDTPTGRLYMAQSYGIMSDPDVAQWQRTAMTGALAKAQENARAFVAELRALPAAAAQ